VEVITARLRLEAGRPVGGDTIAEPAFRAPELAERAYLLRKLLIAPFSVNDNTHFYSSSLALEDGSHRLDLIARVDRQARADRVAGIKRALAGQHLRRNEIAQHRHFAELLLFSQDT